MGMSIEEAISWLLSIAEHEGEDIPIYDDDVKAISIAIETMRKYQQLQADYENRLKADLKAILVELQLDVEGQKFDVHIDKDVWNDAIGVCSELIQEKINELMAESEDKE